METSEKVAAIADALAKAQAEIVGAVKDSTNPYYNSKYADLASVWESCRLPLTKNGLAVVQGPSVEVTGEPHLEQVQNTKGEKRTVLRAVTRVTVTTLLLHSSGEWISTDVSTVVSSSDPQSVGSAISYLRRYGLSSMVGIPQVDDDAEAATSPSREVRKATPEQLPPSVQPASALTLTDAQEIRLKGLMQQHGIKARAVQSFVERTSKYTIKAAHDIRQVDYDRIVEWVISGGK